MENKTTEVRENPTYEQLQNYVEQLAAQNMSLRKRIAETDEISFFRMLDYSFKVIENKEVFPEEFLNKCISNIVEAMTPTAENTENTENTDQ